MYGVVCKPIRKSRDRRDSGSYPPTRFPIRSGLGRFLFFQMFVCFAILTIPTIGWAELTGLTVDAGGDNVFRGGVDRLLIIFTVDDDVSDDGDPYVVDVGTGTVGGEQSSYFHQQPWDH